MLATNAPIKIVIAHGIALGKLIEPAVAVFIYCLSAWLLIGVVEFLITCFVRWKNRKAIKK